MSPSVDGQTRNVPGQKGAGKPVEKGVRRITKPKASRERETPITSTHTHSPQAAPDRVPHSRSQAVAGATRCPGGSRSRCTTCREPPRRSGGTVRWRCTRRHTWWVQGWGGCKLGAARSRRDGGAMAPLGARRDQLPAPRGPGAGAATGGAACARACHVHVGLQRRPPRRAWEPPEPTARPAAARPGAARRALGGRRRGGVSVPHVNRHVCAARPPCRAPERPPRRHASRRQARSG